MELIKEKATVGEVIFSGDVAIETDTAVIVPDVKPDIMKVLGADATAYISEKKMTDGGMLLKGRVDFTVLYMPDSEEKTVQTLKASADFSQRVENSQISADSKAFVSVEVSESKFHVINSRKISLRAISKVFCEVVAQRVLEPVSDAGEGMQISTDTLGVNVLAGMYDEEFVIRDSLELPSGKPSVEELLKADFKICDVETKSMTEKLVVRGTVHACIFYRGGGIEYTEAEFPFTEVFDFPDLCEDDVCELNLRICDVNYDAVKDNDGALRIISFELTACAEMRTERREDFVVLRDCFLPGSKTKLTYSESEIMLSADGVHTQNTLREPVAVPQNAPTMHSVCYADGRGVITKLEVTGKKAAVAGCVKCSIQYISDDADNPIAGFCTDIPFEYLLDVPESEEGAEAKADVSVTHMSYHLNTAGEVEIRCILSIGISRQIKKKLSLISDIETEEIPRESRKGIVIYFVQPGDTLWNIAKEYCVATEDIAEFNSLTDKDSLSVGKRLIIPTKRY